MALTNDRKKLETIYVNTPKGGLNFGNIPMASRMAWCYIIILLGFGVLLPIAQGEISMAFDLLIFVGPLCLLTYFLGIHLIVPMHKARLALVPILAEENITSMQEVINIVNKPRKLVVKATQSLISTQIITDTYYDAANDILVYKNNQKPTASASVQCCKYCGLALNGALQCAGCGANQ